MILVTGGSGFIGGHLVERLCAEGQRVRCLVRRRALAPRPGVEVVGGDLSTGAGLDEALRGVDTVYHLAGVTKTLARAEYHEGNVLATERLARAAAGRVERFVHVSTLAAVGPGGRGAPVTESTPPRPVGLYGRSKLEGERIVRDLLPDAVIVRPPVVYGPRDTDLFQMLRSIRRGYVLRIAGPERWFSSILVTDLVTGLLAAARVPAARGRTYLLAHPVPSSWTELGTIAQRIMGVTARTLTVPVPIAYGVGLAAEGWAQLTRRAGIISRDKVAEALEPWWTCSPARATAELGFTAPTSLADGLAVTLPWYREAGWLSY